MIRQARKLADQRYYNQMGSFWTPDPGGIKTANPKDPGSWNRYAYVQGDPVNFTDRTGLNRDAAECPLDPTISCPGGYNPGGGNPFGTPQGYVQSELDAYVQMVDDAVAAANAHAFDPPDPNCVQDAITAAANGTGLNLSGFTDPWVQIVGASNGNGGTYGETELNMTAASSAALSQLVSDMCSAGFYNNGTAANPLCPNNAGSTSLVGAPHPGFQGNFRSSDFSGSLQVNVNFDTLQIQMDVDAFNPASAPILGAILHGVLQVLPNKISGTDNTYGCNH